MRMIRVRYVGPTDTKGSRLCVTDGELRKQYGFNAIELEKEYHGQASGFHDCTKTAALRFVKDCWQYFDTLAYDLNCGSFKNDDYFIFTKKK